jgi:type I restriction enzyme, S subunit
MSTNGNGKRPLPPGWTWTKLSDACHIELGQSPPSSTYNTDGIGLPFLQGKAEFGDLSPTIVKWCSEPKKTAEPGDVLISVRAPVGSTNLNRKKSCIGRGLAAIRPNNGMSNLYFLYLLRYIQQELIDQATGTTFQAITGKVLREQKIPLAPTSEQYRIVTEIEKQFTRLDQAVASLRRLQGQLARYKASLLKAACNGRLVPQDPNDEPADQLLSRILADRRAQWQAANPGKKYKEPAGVDTAVLPDLPEGWVWATTEQLSHRIVDCLHSTPKFQLSGFNCIDTNSIKPGAIVFEKIRFVDENTFHERNRRMVPQVDDVLFSREGALLGIAARVPNNLQFCLGQRMMVFRLYQGVDAKYFETVLNSVVFKNQYKNKISGTASPHLNIRDIRNLGIPLPPLAEQQRIVEEVERRLSVVAAAEAAVAATLTRSGRLRQTILQRAFSGRLV